MPADAGEPVQEIVNRRPAFQIFEQCLHWHARAFEEPRAAALVSVPFDLRALVPVEHDVIIVRRVGTAHHNGPLMSLVVGGAHPTHFFFALSCTGTASVSVRDRINSPAPCLSNKKPLNLSSPSAILWSNRSFLFFSSGVLDMGDTDLVTVFVDFTTLKPVQGWFYPSKLRVS